ncbi:hypothetical protein KAS08_02035 [Candidatus Pacearchaeota archaeon]|nr:hypothetical protein [Candidatus Pacearchaeota archaeon]
MEVIALYNSQQAESSLARLRFEKDGIEGGEYLATWFSDVLGLNYDQEGIVRKTLEVPSGRFTNLQSRIQTMEKYQTLRLNSGDKQ